MMKKLSVLYFKNEVRTISLCREIGHRLCCQLAAGT